MKAVLILLCLLGAGAAQAQDASALCPLSSAIVVDGNAEEWPMTWLQDDEKVFSYNICADEQNLYVRVLTKDYYAKRKLSAFGFTLWFDPAGKKKRKLGLKYPAGGNEAEERMASVRKQSDVGNSLGEKADYQKEIDRALIAGIEVIELIGLADDPITATRSGITNGIKVAIALDASGAYVYEALIPFKSYRLSRASITELSIGFETGRFVVPKQKRTTKDVVDNTLSTSQLSRMQGYENMMANPKLTTPSNAWASLKLK